MSREEDIADAVIKMQTVIFEYKISRREMKENDIVGDLEGEADLNG